jgi:hypothetical protein
LPPAFSILLLAFSPAPMMTFPSIRFVALTVRQAAYRAANPGLRCLLNVRVAPDIRLATALGHNRLSPSLPLLYPRGRQICVCGERLGIPVLTSGSSRGERSTPLRYSKRQHGCVVLDAGTEAFEQVGDGVDDG